MWESQVNPHAEENCEELQLQLERLAEQVRAIAQTHQGNSLSLLALLRALEYCHQEIREGEFQESLPDNRQKLYHLLREIESSGGWPYIPRMSIQALQQKILAEEAQETADDSQMKMD
ncbi:MAG: hypothetical protein ACFBSC_03280 [Microcoleaceae cyanobacterium]